MFDTLIAWFEIPVVLYAYLLGVGGMSLLYNRHYAKRDEDFPFALWFPYKVVYCAVAAVCWPFVVMRWVFERILRWGIGIGL